MRPIRTSFEEIGEHFDVVYVENSILSKERGVQNFPWGQRIGLAQHLGASQRFRELSPRILYRHLRGVELINRAIKQQNNMTCIPEVLEKYEAFLIHVKNVRDYLVKKGSKQAGRLQLELEEIARLHQSNYEILLGRITNGNDYSLRPNIIINRMHIPKRGELERKTQETSEVCPEEKICLASAALTLGSNGKNVAIATCDLDVANIIYNYGSYLKKKGVKSPMVSVYFPQTARWTKTESGMLFMVDTLENCLEIKP